MRNVLIAIIITAVFYTAWFAGNYPQAFYYINVAFQKIEQIVDSVESQFAAVILHRPVTVNELQDKYKTPSKKIRVLVVPGHEPGYGGTEYGSLKEREMNVELAGYLGEFLKNNGRYDVMLSRNDAAWSPTIENYFKNNWDQIISFFRESKDENLRIVTPSSASLTTPLKPLATSTAVVTTGKTPTKKVFHNAAPMDVALRLYGMNKWGNENAVDIAIHVHFNDYPRRNMDETGKYTGFAVYVPEKQYDNSPTTRAVADTVFKRLAKYNAVSNLPMEDDGIVEDEELIAIGAHNTSNAASMLVEYGYIYEPQFANEEVRHSTLKDLAFQTYLGLQDFFGSGNDVSFAYDTLMLPHSWNGELSAKKNTTEDVLALQSALLLDGFYPVDGKTKNDCPRTGKIGPCTLSALEAFQKRYGIKGENGVVGEKTRVILNGKYSVKTI